MGRSGDMYGSTIIRSLAWHHVGQDGAGWYEQPATFAPGWMTPPFPPAVNDAMKELKDQLSLTGASGLLPSTAVGVSSEASSEVGLCPVAGSWI